MGLVAHDLRDGIEPSGAERPTPEDTPESHPRAREYPVGLNGLNRILGTGGMKAAS